MASGLVVPHKQAEHMAAPTKPAGVKKVLANSEPSTHGTSATSQDRRLTSAFDGRAVVQHRPMT
jgi:hypothetical protein